MSDTLDKKTIVRILAKLSPETRVVTLTADDLLTLMLSDESAATLGERWGGCYVNELATRLTEKERA